MCCPNDLIRREISEKIIFCNINFSFIYILSKKKFSFFSSDYSEIQILDVLLFLSIFVIFKIIKMSSNNV